MVRDLLKINPLVKKKKFQPYNAFPKKGAIFPLKQKKKKYKFLVDFLKYK